MLRFLLLLPIVLNAGIFDWFDSLTPKAKRAQELLQGFDEKIEKALADYQVPGIAVGIVVDGHVIYAKGFGYRDLEKKLPMTKDTVCAMGSCTKAFTTFAMGNLVDDGLVRWDDLVIDVLPEFRLADQYATSNLTVRDLLTHRTGMPRHDFVWYNSKMSKEELLKRIRYLQPSFDFRERYQYGQLMYFTAGLAMERMVGNPWEEIVQRRILNPLGMTHTNFSVEESQKSNDFAYPYIEKMDVLKKIPFRNLSLIGGAGSMNSNIEDMTHWLKMLLAGGVYDDRAMINPATLQELHAPQIIVPGAPDSKETLLYAYGMGWAVLSYRGNYFVSHDGVSDGFTSMVGFLPSENIGIVICTNKNISTLPRYLSFEMIDKILELPHHEWLEEGIESIRKNKESQKQRIAKEDLLHKKETTPCHPLEEYTGVYEDPGYGKVEIEIVDGKLEANYNDLLFVLDHWHYDVFNVAREKQAMIISLEGTKFAFSNNSQGQVSELVIPFEPTADDIVFKKKSKDKHSTLAYLRQFVGAYEIYGYVVEIVVRDNTLIAVIPGQPNYELVPMGENEFSVKTMTGSTVQFVLDANNKVQEVILIHPYGAFSATPKR